MIAVVFLTISCVRVVAMHGCVWKNVYKARAQTRKVNNPKQKILLWMFSERR